METETYKKAKEILEKFDPETKKKLEEERNRSENPVPQTPVASGETSAEISIANVSQSKRLRPRHGDEKGH